MRELDLSEAISPAVTLTFLALVVVHRAHGSATVREISLARGGCSAGAIHGHLVKLREAGLCDWEDGKIGTLRPLVAVVPAGMSPTTENARAVPSLPHDHDHDRDNGGR